MNARLAAFVHHFEGMAPATLRIQRELVAIPAPTGREAARATFVRDRFRQIGLEDARIDAAGNVIARRPGIARAPCVSVCAHLDTVFPEGTDVTVRQDGTRLYGPGITDNARGLAAMLSVAEGLTAMQLRTERPIDFVATVGEEGHGDLRGAKAYFRDADRPAAAIAIDGAGDGHVVHRAVGARRFRISYRGRGGHSWGDFGLPNAVNAAALCATRLAALPLPKDPRTTLTVARIDGGGSINSIPASASLEVDLRSTSAAVIASLESEMRAIARRASNEVNGERRHVDGALSTEILRLGDRPCGDVPDDHPLVRAALAIAAGLGREPHSAAASTDASVPMALGIPSIALGGGGTGGLTHTLGEWFDPAGASRGVAQAFGVVLAAAGCDSVRDDYLLAPLVLPELNHQLSS